MKFTYYCPKCGLTFVTGRDAEWTCNEDCGARLIPDKVEHWDCNGEFEWEETYAEWVEGLPNE